MAGETTQRVLRLLEALQRRPVWTSQELAGELSVTTRTIRRDVDRLRDLGYPVRATPGAGGGYQLGRGGRMPPLLLDDEEAAAVAVSLRLAASTAVTGAGEAGLRALAKLDRVMSPRLRSRVRAVRDATESPDPGVSEVEPETLLEVARACRDRLRLRFTYSAGSGAESERAVEPVRMVTTGHRWYLMAWDPDRGDWRTFRLDRLRDLRISSVHFPDRPHPDPVDYVQSSVTSSRYRHEARVRIHAGIDELADRLPPQIARLEADDRPGWTLMTTGGDSLEWLAVHIAMLGRQTEVIQPTALSDAAAQLALALERLSGR